MAKRVTTTKRGRAAQVQEVTHRCRDCERSYDWHSKALDGHLILCRCPLKQQGGKFCVFLNDPSCESFIQRTSEPDITEK